MAVTYYVKIDGISGDSTSKGHEGWFELPAFSFGEANPGVLDGGVLNAGVAYFSDVSLALNDYTALTSLLADNAGGKHIAAVEIEGVSDGEIPRTVFDLTLNDVIVSSVVGGDAAGGAAGLNVTLGYSRFGLVTTSQNPDGSAGAEQSFGWDLAAHKAIDPATLTTPTNAGTTEAVPDPVTYYLKIDGIAGDSVSKDHKGWFEISSYSLGESIAALVGPDGLVAGKANFQSINVALGDATPLAALLADSAASGRHISAVEIEGVSGGASPRTVFDLTLNDVQVSSVQQSASGGGDPAVSLTFDFGQIGLVTTSQNPDGSAGAEHSFGWDIAANKAIDPATLTTPINTSVAAVPDPVTYYVRIDGVAGDSTSKDHKGWFELPSFSLGESQSGALTGGGAGAGKADFQSLFVNLEADAALASLLASSASGKHITAVEIEGVSGGATPRTVFDLTLNDVIVSSVATGGSPGGASSIGASFDYSRIGLVTTSQNADGSAGAQQSFGWDIAANKAIDPATLTAPTSTSVVDVPDPVTYYLKIDGIAGDSTSKDHKGWFEIDSYQLGESIATLSGSDGLEAGKVNFQNLNVSLGDATMLAALLGDGASGRHIAAVEIEGVSGGATPRTVFDLTLNDVQVSSVQQGASSGGGPAINVGFDFGQIGLVTTSQNPDGSLGAEQSFGWDVAANKAIDPATLSTPTNTSVAGVPDPVTYYVRIDGIAGDSTSKDHKGWFELPAFSLGESQSGSLAGGGAGAGKADFQALSVNLGADAALASLLASSASGKHITALEIEGVSGGTTPRTVFDLTLNDVVVSSVSTGDSAGGESSIGASFDYSRIGLVTTSQNPDGSAGAQQSFGWDIAANKAIDPATLTAPTSTSAVEVPDPVTYYLKIDGVTGDSTSKDHKGWFEIDAYQLGESNVANLFGGSGAGKAAFSDVQVVLANNAALTALLANSAAGKHLAAVEIEGVSGGANPRTVFDLTLNDVLVSSVSSGANADQSAVTSAFSFGYSRIGLVTTAQNKDGSLGDRHEFGWDLLAAKAIDPDLLVTPDDQAPLVAIGSLELASDTGASAHDLVTRDGHVTLTGTASDDVSVASVHILDGTTDLGAATLVGTNWTFSAELAPGTHVLSALATDSGGQTASTAAQPAIVVDVAAPSLTMASEVLTNDAGASPSDFITNDGRFTLAGAVSDDLTAVGVHVFDGTNDLGAATVLDGGWSFSGTLLAGTHHLSAVAVDLAGNSTSVDAAHDITVDATAPTVATSFQHLLIDTGSSSTDRITSDGRIALGGTAADNLALASVHIFDGATDLGAASVVNGNWSFETVLGAGTHTLVAVAYDVAGNHTASLPQASVTVVPQAPIVGNPLQAVVHGTSGAETIVFGTNNRIVIGGNGNDVFAIAGGSSFAGHMVVGGGGTDTLDLSSLGSPLNVRLGGGLAIGSGLGQFFAVSVENVIGGSGNDTLGASNSVNTLTGGRGADVFVYASLNDARNPGAPAGAANDTITDFHEAALFSAGQRDVIDLRGIDAVLGGRDDAFAFVTSPWNGAGNAFTAAGQIRYQFVVDSAGQEHTLILGNVDRIGQGNGLAADFVIDLIGHHQLAAADFLL